MSMADTYLLKEDGGYLLQESGDKIILESGVGIAMTKTTIATLVGNLCHDLDDSTEISTFHDDVMEEISKSPRSPFVDYDTISIVSGTSQYNFPSDAIRMLALFYKDAHLSPSTISDLEAYDKDWLTTTGDPWAFTPEDRSYRKYRLFPEPDESGDDNVALYTDKRDDSIEDWIALGMAHDILAKEFARPSDHQDVAYAAACDKMAKLIYQMAGLQIG